jgi:hypothetical protein
MYVYINRAMPLQKDPTTTFGLAQGANILFVVQPRMLTQQISQDFPLANGENTITVSLVSLTDLPRRSRITITGLTGSATTSSSSIALTTPTFLVPSATWNGTAGSLVIETTRGGMPANFLTIFTFVVTNGPLENAESSIWLSGFVESSSGATVDARSASFMGPSRMSTDNTAILGILNGSNPLKYLRPYLIKNISQSSAQVSSINTLTVTLQLNLQLHSAQGSELTLSGLVHSATLSTASLPLTYPDGYVSVFGTTGKWTQSTGTLRLAISSAGSGALEARQMYVFSFQV